MAKKKETMAEIVNIAINKLLESTNKTNFQLRCEIAKLSEGDSIIQKYRRSVCDKISETEIYSEISYMFTDGSILVRRKEFGCTDAKISISTFKSLKGYQDACMEEDKNYKVEYRQLD